MPLQVRSAITVRRDRGELYALRRDLERLPSFMAHVVEVRVDPSFVVTHRMSLDDAPEGYETFKNKQDARVKVVLRP